MPNGDIVNFPDDMPPEQIRSLIEQKFPEVLSSPAPAPTPPAEPMQAQQREGLFPQLASGMTEGAANLLSLPNTIELGLRSIGPAIGNAMGGEFAYPDQSVLPDAGESFRNFANNTGAMTEPTDNAAGRVARRVGNEIGANIIPMAGTFSKPVSIAQALARGGTELGLTATSGLGAGIANEISPNNPGADLVGQALGFATGAGLIEGGRRLITPNPISPDRLAVVKALQDQGIELTAGQATGSPRLKAMESELGGNVAQNFMENQGEQFTSAALAKAGISAPRATPDVLAKGYQDIGNEFDRLATKSQFPFDARLQNELLDISTNYSEVTGMPARAVETVMNRAAELASKNGGIIDGEAYKNLRSKIGELAKSADAPTQGALLDIQSALDDAVESYIPVEEIGAWQAVRDQYRNFLVLERAATAAGENAASGLLSPGAIRQAAVAVQGRRNYATGSGDFSDLSHSANAAMTPLPNSGTATRSAAQNLFASGPTIAGTVLGGAAGAGNPMAAIAGGLAGAAVPGQVGKALLSPLGRKYLTNQAVLPGAGYGENASNAVLRALIGQGAYDQ